MITSNLHDSRDGRGVTNQADIVTVPAPDFADQAVSSLLTVQVKIQRATLAFLEGNLSRLLPGHFPEAPHVEILIGDGVTANFFKVTSTVGRQYFIKARSLDDAEQSMGEDGLQWGKTGKEVYCSERCRDAGVTVAQVFHPIRVPACELPAALEGLHSGAIRGRERPFVLNLQGFVDGLEGMQGFEGHPLQVLVCHNLGRELGVMNRIPTKGFGGHFNPTTQSFMQSWHDRYAEMELQLKALELHALGILNRAEFESFGRLLEPLAHMVPESVLIHADVHPPNYKYKINGSISALIDLEGAEGGPWQSDFGAALARIEALPLRIPTEQRKERATAFVTGYGRTSSELQENWDLINAFKAAE